MNIRRITTLVLVLSILLAGCSAIDPPVDPGKPTATQTDANETPAENEDESTPTATSSDESEDSDDPEDSEESTTTTTTSAETTTTTTTTETTVSIEGTSTVASSSTAAQNTSTQADWPKPKPPTRPTESKIEQRITNTKFINKEQATSSSGYSNFDVQIFADTRLKNVDPEGDVDGEPYFIIEINNKLVARASVTYEKNGSFAIEVPTAALKQFASGTLNVRVSFLDQDSQSDDLYDTWSGTIEYSAS
ncbi:hypothetical protein [Halocatena marina]|uniref:hypothetical protein n=1 Tax=Halocatena marina TaxID=2934937 RepID=UPI00200DABD6|nr:hypothetical protein [Halocatena marina]